MVCCALKSVLKEAGLMGIMVYGEYGRLGVYPMQQMMRYLNRDVTDRQEQLKNGKGLLAQIPERHTFKAHNLMWKREQELFGDQGFYDMFLHSQDRAYNVTQLYDWVEACGLKIVHLGLMPTPAIYNPAIYIRDPELREKVVQLPLREQQHIAEIMHGNMVMHVFYVGCDNKRIARPSDRTLVPFLFPEYNDHKKIADQMETTPGDALVISRDNFQIRIAAHAITTTIVRLMDGRNTIADILKKTAEHLNKKGVRCNAEAIETAFDKLYGQLNMADWILLRRKRRYAQNTRAFGVDVVARAMPVFEAGLAEAGDGLPFGLPCGAVETTDPVKLSLHVARTACSSNKTINGNFPRCLSTGTACCRGSMTA